MHHTHTFALMHAYMHVAHVTCRVCVHSIESNHKYKQGRIDSLHECLSLSFSFSLSAVFH